MDIFNADVQDDFDLSPLIPPMWISHPQTGGYGSFADYEAPSSDTHGDDVIPVPYLPHKVDVDKYLFGFSIYWRSLMQTLTWLTANQILPRDGIEELKSSAINTLRNANMIRHPSPKAGPRPSYSYSVPQGIGLPDCDITGVTICTRHKENMWIVFKKNVIIRANRPVMAPKCTPPSTFEFPIINQYSDGSWEVFLPPERIVKIIAVAGSFVREASLGSGARRS